jgi:AcrR family transcriptional regulator
MVYVVYSGKERGISPILQYYWKLMGSVEMDDTENQADILEFEASNSRNYRISTKQKILICAVDIFAIKGYTETSIRDIASAAGIKSSSIYNHFSSKEDLLKYMLYDFNDHTQGMFNNPEMPAILQNKPTVEGIMSCIQISFAVLSDEYYFKVLHVIYHEQHRNDIIKSFVAKTILEAEAYIEKIFDTLKSLNIIHSAADADFWKKNASSLLYAFPNRMMLGIGEDFSGFTGMGLKDLLSYMFSLIFKMYSVTDNQE